MVEDADAGLSEGFEAHVAATDGLLVDFFGHDGSDEADDRGSGGEDAGHVGAAPELPVQSLVGVVGPDLAGPPHSTQANSATDHYPLDESPRHGKFSL